MRQNESEEYKERSAGGPNSEFFAKDKVGTDKADHRNKISIGGGFQEFWDYSKDGGWQGKKDSNPRMPESESGALTSLAIPLQVKRDITQLL